MLATIMRVPEQITDPKDPRIEGYVGLKDGERIRQHGRFIAESRPVVARLLAHRPTLVESVLTTERQWLNLQEDGVERPPCPIYLADRALLTAVAGFPIHRGCLALARCPPLNPASLWSQGSGWWLGLESVSDHDNVGSLLRTARVLGARGVLHTGTCADPLYRRSVRVSMGAAFILERASGAWTDLVARCREAGIRTAALTPKGDTDLTWGTDPFGGGRWALWLGAEGPGLSDGLIETADLRLRIPMAPGADSLNVAVAAALAAWAYHGRGSADSSGGASRDR
ncbi:MAG: RNA methyltransferase [Myxococcota bacterium]